MPWATQTVQVVIFTPDQPSAYDVLRQAFECSPTNFQVAPPPAVGGFASAPADGRLYTAQIAPGRIDLVIGPFVPTDEAPTFAPLPGDRAAHDVVEAALRVLSSCSAAMRISLAVRRVYGVSDDDESVSVFARITGVDPARLGPRDNVFQTNHPSQLPDMLGVSHNRITQCRTELSQMINITAGPGVVQQVVTRERRAVTLTHESNVLSTVGPLPRDKLGALMHLVQHAVEGPPPDDVMDQSR